jgi:hypothetical protein
MLTVLLLANLDWVVYIGGVVRNPKDLVPSFFYALVGIKGTQMKLSC